MQARVVRAEPGTFSREPGPGVLRTPDSPMSDARSSPSIVLHRRMPPSTCRVVTLQTSELPCRATLTSSESSERGALSVRRENFSARLVEDQSTLCDLAQPPAPASRIR